MKILFLDIDGVLNRHEYCGEAKSNGIDPKAVVQLNRIIACTDCKIVISSAWRYMITRGAMTLAGFGYMLQTHGVACGDRIIGTTTESSQVDEPRGKLIRLWLGKNTPDYAILDDLDLGLSAHGKRFVHTPYGLDAASADRVIKVLNDQ